jgi:hypothetical protein
MKERASLYGQQASRVKSTVGEHTKPYDTDRSRAPVAKPDPDHRARARLRGPGSRCE